MSSISSINSAITSYQSTSSTSQRKDPMKKTMDDMADFLGVSASELKEDRKNGKTLDDVAKEKGISTDDLHAKLAESLKANAPADAPSDADYSKMATDIASGQGPKGGHHGHRADSDGSNSSSDQLSSLLSNMGISETDLVSMLSSTSSSSSSSTTSSSDDSSTSDSSSSFAAQLKALVNQYGSKGNVYDTTL